MNKMLVVVSLLVLGAVFVYIFNKDDKPETMLTSLNREKLTAPQTGGITVQGITGTVTTLTTGGITALLKQLGTQNQQTA